MGLRRCVERGGGRRGRGGGEVGDGFVGRVGLVDLMLSIVIIPPNCMSPYLVACIGRGEG